jgi:hypothetical protein
MSSSKKKKAAKSPKKAAKSKAPAKPKPKAKAKTGKSTAKKKGSVGAASTSKVHRRDGTGHLDAKYAADLRAKSRESADDSDDNRAFLRRSRTQDSLGEELGEEAVRTMTSGEDQSDQLQNLQVDEENGGPFVTTSARQEFARGTDRSNPRKSTREPFPKT